MEYQEITNPLDNIPDKVPTFITGKWIEVHDQSGNLVNRCKPRKQITFETSMLQSDLCDYHDAYIVVKGTIIVTGDNNRGRKNRSLAFKNDALFISCITKIK